MQHRIFALSAALVILLATAAVAQTGKPLTIKLAAQNGSGETGTATLAQDGSDVVVTVKMSGGNSAGPQPIHIHEGTCDKLNPAPKYPLTTVQDGASKTTLKDMQLTALETGGFAINVHHSTTDIPTYVACGDIPKA